MSTTPAKGGESNPWPIISSLKKDVPLLPLTILFERSEFLIATCKKKKTDRLSGCMCVRMFDNLGFSVEKLYWF